MISAYYKLALLSDEVRASNKIRSKARLDCIAFSDNTLSGYNGLTNFVNCKGQLFFYKAPARSLLALTVKGWQNGPLLPAGLIFPVFILKI